MYTVYCYAYYFTIKETKVGNSGLCYRQGWNFKEHLDTLKAGFCIVFICVAHWFERGILTLYIRKD